MNTGATLTKLSQNGKNPKPADLGQADRPTTVRFDLAVVWFMILSTKTSQLKGGSSKIHKLRSKGLNQVKMGSMPITNQRIETQTGLRSNVDPVNNVPERRRPERSQSQADRPRRGQPLTTSVGAMQLPPTSGGNQERPRKGGGQMAASPGRPA